MTCPIPRVVVAAPASGAGKTTVATGLMAALAARGLRVAPFKVGPDYIDPGYHALATGRPGRNLDAFLCGEELVGPLFARGAAGADVAVVEGVMGLFDGRGGTPYASTAHVAQLLDAPVLLVVDARSMSSSVAALVHGFATYDPAVRVAGVVLNRVGSPTHEAMLRAALAPLGLPVLGALHRDDRLAAPSRHLGLVPVAERAAAARAGVGALAAAVARAVDLDAVLRLARTAAPLAATPWEPPLPAARRPATVAVAAGPAFTFVYPETVEVLAAAGCTVAPFDPLRDERLPAGASGLYLGGGFPEEYAGELAANEPMRRAVAGFAGAVYAECAGLLYLCRSLDGQQMCGRLPADARMTERLTLGYREAVDDLGEPVRAHEFHRTAADPGHGPHPAFRIGERAEGWRDGDLAASYLHVHWAGRPAAAHRFAAAAARWAA